MAKHIYCRHSIELEVPFFDVDAMHIVWHGHYVKYLELARCALLGAIGYDYIEMERQGFMWPIVQMSLKYVKPARFGQQIRIEAAVTEIESCLRIDYTTTLRAFAHMCAITLQYGSRLGAHLFSPPPRNACGRR